MFTYKKILLRTPILTLYNALPHLVMYLFSFKQVCLFTTTIKAYDRKHVLKMVTNGLWQLQSSLQPFVILTARCEYIITYKHPLRHLSETCETYPFPSLNLRHSNLDFGISSNHCNHHGLHNHHSHHTHRIRHNHRIHHNRQVHHNHHNRSLHSPHSLCI